MANSSAWQEPNIPYNDDAARWVLGAILYDRTMYPQLAEILRPSDFYPTHRAIWEAASAIVAEGGTPDELTVVDWLERHGRLAEAGGLVTITPLSTGVPPEYPHAAVGWATILLKNAESRAHWDLSYAHARASQQPLDAIARADIVRHQAALDDIQRRLRGEENDLSHNSRFADSRHAPPSPMRVEAYYGLAGDITRAIAPHTEADPDGVLVQILAIIGAYAGRKTYFKVSADRHYPNLYAVLVGDTAMGRKGMSWGAAKHIFTTIDALDEWLREHVIGGMSSGEGLMHPVRDYRESDGDEGKKRPPEPLQLDKRVIVRESEFSSVLKMPARDGNNLSEVQRRAWDGDPLQTLTKNSPERATGAHIVIIGNITREELARYLSQTDTANGFANRYLWIFVARARFLPDGGDIDSVDFDVLSKRLVRALQALEDLPEGHVMTRDPEARELWHKHYERLTTGSPGLFGAMTARAAAQVMRLAMIYALLDSAQVIRAPHLEAALAVWEYAEDSVRYLFGDALGDPIADTILRKLRATPEGLTRTEISGLFGRHAKATEIDRALGLLHERHLAYFEKADPEKGRPVERWFGSTATSDANVRNANYAKKAPPAPPDNIISLNSQFADSQPIKLDDAYVDSLNAFIASQFPRMPVCPYPAHEPKWYTRKDGSQGCDVCHPRPSSLGA